MGWEYVAGEGEAAEGSATRLLGCGVGNLSWVWGGGGV